MSVISIKYDSPEVLEAIQKMERAGKLEIVNVGKLKRNDRSRFYGALKMTKERMEEYLGDIEEERQEWDERLSR